MKKTLLLPALLPFAACFGLLSVARVAHADQAADAYSAFCAAFLVQSGGQTYFSEDVSSQMLSDPGGWGDATVIYLAEDVYERTPTAANRAMVGNLVSTFFQVSGTDWSGDNWNDDLAWMVTAALRGYQITGNQTFYTIAETTWNLAYNRGWDTTYAEGGVWELDWGADAGGGAAPTSKCALSNDPLITTGLLLYQITGDSSYLQKSQNMYDWMKSHLVAASGQVNGCWAFKDINDTVGFDNGGGSDNAYDSGSFLEAAEYFYRITGTQAYHDDALAAVTFRTTKDKILHSGNEGDNQWAYHFLRGLRQLATFNGLWAQYQPWLESNANAAWSERNALNLTWNDWTAPTVMPMGSNGITPLSTSSAVAIWQHLPQSPNAALAGTFELKNLHSGLSLTVQDADDAGSGGDAGDAIPVVQASFADADAGLSLWTFVSTAGAYYQIQNVETGLLLSVEGNSARAGASIVVSPAAPHAQGNDQWLPVLNTDGSYSFYNLSTILALDDPGASTSAGAQLGQWFGNGTPGQSFTLVAHSLAASDAGADAGDGGSIASPFGPDAGSPGAAGLDAEALPAPDAEVPPTRDASNAAGETAGGGTTSSGCGCTTVGSSATPASRDGLALVAFGALLAFLRRRKSVPRALSR